MDNITKKYEVLELLFKEHHRQLSEISEKTRELSHRIVGVLIAITGWVVIGTQSLPNFLRWLLVGCVVSVSVAACFTMVRYTRNYRTIAKIISKINRALGVFEKDIYLHSDSIYPNKWKNFGSEPLLSGVWAYLLIIIFVAALCVIAILVK